MATLSEFKTRYPELGGSDDYLTACLDDAALDVSASILGSDLDRGIMLLAAHYAVSTAGAGARGVQSVSAGSASITYASGSSRSDYSSTGYGAQFKALVRKHTGMQIVGSC